jgi:hypothetical protein
MESSPFYTATFFNSATYQDFIYHLSVLSPSIFSNIFILESSNSDIIVRCNDNPNHPEIFIILSDSFMLSLSVLDFYNLYFLICSIIDNILTCQFTSNFTIKKVVYTKYSYYQTKLDLFINQII